MASKVNLWTVPAEDFSLLLVVTTGTEGLQPVRCTATFIPGVSTRLHPTALGDRSQRALRLGLLAAALTLPRSETLACPTSAKQNDKITLQRTVSVRTTARREGSLGASALGSSSAREKRRNVSGANQDDEVGIGDAARRFGIPWVPLRHGRAVRSSLAASVRSLSSPTRPASFFTDRS